VTAEPLLRRRRAPFTAVLAAHIPFGQCCQLMATIFGQTNQKIRPLAKKFGL
jgi:hypothetical protein